MSVHHQHSNGVGAKIYGEIAKQMGIARSTLFRWCDRDEILKDALLVSRDIADRQVENALYKMAKGFHYKEDKVSASGKLLHNVDQYHEPNVSAAKFWLMNRKGHTSHAAFHHHTQMRKVSVSR